MSSGSTVRQLVRSPAINEHDGLCRRFCFTAVTLKKASLVFIVVGHRVKRSAMCIPQMSTLSSLLVILPAFS